MILYHVTFDLMQDNVFVPRVPETRADSENDTIKRICFSRTVEGALSAMPDGGYRLDETIYKFDCLIKVFQLDTEKLNISPKNILEPEYLYERDYVRDALETEEYWILEDVVIPREDVEILEIINYDMDSFDYVPAKIYNEAMDGDGDLIRVWQKYNNNIKIPCSTLITNLKCRKLSFEELSNKSSFSIIGEEFDSYKKSIGKMEGKEKVIEFVKYDRSKMSKELFEFSVNIDKKIPFIL